MSTPHVTIGGMEVSLTPGSAALAQMPPLAQPRSRAQEQARQAMCTVAVLAALTLMIVLIGWFGLRRPKR